MERLTMMTPKGAALKMENTYPNEDAARADLMQKYCAAVARLAAYEDTELGPEEIMARIAPLPNPPLTLEELREMGGEPVYIHFIGCAQHLPSGWAFVCTTWGGCKMGNGTVAFFGRYGETWLAYRRKPEEATL